MNKFRVLNIQEFSTIENENLELRKPKSAYFDFLADLGGVRCAPKYFSLR